MLIRTALISMFIYWLFSQTLNYSVIKKKNKKYDIIRNNSTIPTIVEQGIKLIPLSYMQFIERTLTCHCLYQTYYWLMGDYTFHAHSSCWIQHVVYCITCSRREYAFIICHCTLTFVQNMYDRFAPGRLDSSWIIMKYLQRDVKIRPKYAWNIWHWTLSIQQSINQSELRKRGKSC